MILEELKKKDLEKIFDQNSKIIIDFLLKRTLISYPEFLEGQNQKSVYLEKKQCEQWIVQSLGLKPVGEGSYPIDGIDKNSVGYDVSTVNWGVTKTGKNKTETGEKSLSQKFSDSNFGNEEDTLDELFKNKKFTEILNNWKTILKNKWNNTIKEKSLKKIILINLVKHSVLNKMYILGLQINPENIDQCEIKPPKILKKTNKKPKEPASVHVSNFISDELGSIKIYKSKKRIELRIKPEKWLENNSYIEFSYKFNNKVKNLREEFLNRKKPFLKELAKEYIKFLKEFLN
jgi:hypothetical protein